MNKKLLAVAVAGALAAPGVALAQASSVTISGIFKVGIDNVSYSGATSTGQTGANPPGRAGNTRETRVSDNSSRIIFGVREDLGNGLAAVAQADMRFNPASSGQPGGMAGAGLGGIAGGNTWVGLDSKTMGRLTLGRHDLHYGKVGDSWNTAGAGSLQTWSASIFDAIGRPGAASATAPRGTSQVSLASNSRTQQVIRWDSPKWNGFDATIAWSANPLTQGAGGASTGGDLGQGLAGTGGNAGTVITRKGDGWNINPRYNAANWGVEYSYWNAKGDINSSGVTLGSQACNSTAVVLAGTCTGTSVPAVTAGQSLIQDDQRSDVLSGYYNVAGFRLGLAWNRSKTTNVASGLTTGDRAAWAIPISYTTGPHLFGFVWVKANDSKDVTTAAGATVSGADTGARMYTLTYNYNLSKRTAVGLTWSQLQNRSNANYAFFYNSPTAFGSANTGMLAGERVQIMAATVRHNF